MGRNNTQKTAFGFFPRTSACTAQIVAVANTGTLEAAGKSLTFEGTKLDPKYNRIIIDEAHVTIEANPSIELGIALARKRGVKIDYMSATVDPSTLQRDLGVKIVYAEAQWRFARNATG